MCIMSYITKDASNSIHSILVTETFSNKFDCNNSPLSIFGLLYVAMLHISTIFLWHNAITVESWCIDIKGTRVYHFRQVYHYNRAKLSTKFTTTGVENVITMWEDITIPGITIVRFYLYIYFWLFKHWIVALHMCP